MASAGSLSRRAVLNYYAGKPDAVKVAPPVWSEGKAERPYLSLPVVLDTDTLLYLIKNITCLGGKYGPDVDR
jgi:hypothetical protein